MAVVLYSTYCPRCSVLETKLKEKNIEFEINDNADEMLAKGFSTVPMLEVDGKALDFKEAIVWLNNNST